MPARVLDDDDATDGRTGSGPLALILTPVVTLAVGTAVGFVVGDKRGRANNARETAEAKEIAEQAIKDRAATENKMAAAVAGRDADRAEYENTSAMRDKQLADERAAAEAANKQLAAAEKKISDSQSAAAAAQLAKAAKNLPRPAELEEGTINVGKDRTGLMGQIEGSMTISSVIDDRTAVFKVESTYVAGVNPKSGALVRDSRTDYFYAQNFPTKDMVDGTYIKEPGV